MTCFFRVLGAQEERKSEQTGRENRCGQIPEISSVTALLDSDFRYVKLFSVAAIHPMPPQNLNNRQCYSQMTAGMLLFPDFARY
jgi:hypothetical protein